MNQASSSPATLQVSGLNKEFKTAAGTLSILQGVDLELAAGDAAAVTGPSGSGKSTLLYIIGTLDEPTGGEVRIDGEDPFARSERGRAEYRNKSVGFVFQDSYLLPQCTVLENVLIPLLAGSGADDQATQRAEQLLQRVGLDERLTHRPSQLSGGERQRVGICRALINDPILLLADEPTGNLDEATADLIGSLLLEVAAEQGVTLVCVTHSLPLAGRFPHRFELHAGRLVEQGSAAADRTAEAL